MEICQRRSKIGPRGGAKLGQFGFGPAPHSFRSFESNTRRQGDRVGIEPRIQFAEKLDALADSGKIRASEKEALEARIGAGSAAPHRGWQPESEQLDVEMDVL